MSSGFGKKAGPTPSSLSESPFGPPQPPFPHFPPRYYRAFYIIIYFNSLMLINFNFTQLRKISAQLKVLCLT
jgi:hypothetical protein